MASMLKKLLKLKGRSLEELRVRGLQEASALAERAGLSQLARVPDDAAFFRQFNPTRVGGAPSAEMLLAHFRTRTAPRFFAAFAEPAATRAELRARFAPRHETILLGRVRKIISGRFDLLGLTDLSFGSPINWQLEPVSGKSAPLAHWSRINYLDPEVAGDKKVTWELNRQQYFQTLGRAYWYTGNEEFAATFVAHASDWMEHNPPKLGINWASSLEVSFRLISWLWALYFFQASPQLTPPFFARLLKFIYLHALHLETYLSTYFSPNTHLTGEALGLFYVGTLFPEFRAGPRWRETGERIMLAQLERQIRSDGVYFEQSTYYQRYTADFYLHLLALTEANDAPLAPQLRRKLIALLDFLMHATRPDGSTPFFGDDDGGRLALLDDGAANDFRPTLSTGAALIGRGDYKFVAGDAAEETLWLTGRAGLRRFDELAAKTPAQGSRAFTDGGYYVLRDGWTRDANYMMLDCGPHGDIGAHAHADVLSFDMVARGRTLLVDPGTYTYTGAQELRDHFRSTAAHNTLTIDGQSSSVPAGPFSWQQTARATARKWESYPRYDLFEGEHDGYARLASPAIHARGVLFLKGDYWIVRDRVATAGAHVYQLNFHYAPGAEPALTTDEEGAALRTAPDGQPGCDVFTFGGDGGWSCADGWVSSCYAARTPAQVCTYAVTGAGTQEFVTLLVPRAPSAVRTRARIIAATGGRAFELEVEGWRDCAAIKDGGVVEFARFATDFAWAWVRFERADATAPVELVLLDGSFFHIDGREAVCAAARVGRIVARRVGEEWYVESDAGDDLFIALDGARRVRLNDGQPRPLSAAGQAEYELTGAAAVRGD